MNRQLRRLFSGLLLMIILATTTASTTDSAGAATIDRDTTNDGSIIITKQTLGNRDGTFTFTGDLEFTITTADGGGNHLATSLTPGTYVISERFDTEWDFVSLACDDPTGNTTVTGRTVSVGLASGDVINCVYVNGPDIAPDIEIDKRNDADGDGIYGDDEQAPVGGSTVPFTLSITNNGSEPVSIDTIVDDTYLATVVAGTCDDLIGESIAPSSQVDCRFDGQFPDKDNLTEISTILVQVSDDDDDIVEVSDETTVRSANLLPEISVQVDNDANADDLYNDEEQLAGDRTVPFRVTIRNTSAESVTIERIANDIDGDNGENGEGGDCIELIGTTLSTNAEVSCGFLSLIEEGDAFTTVKQVTVDAADDDGNIASAGDTSKVFVPDIQPELAVVKTVDVNGDGLFADQEVASKGGITVTYGVTITNDASEAIVLVSIEDDIHDATLAGGTCHELVGAMLAPEGQTRCLFSGWIADDDNINELSTVTVTAADDEENVDAASDAATVVVADIRPDITVETTNDADGNGRFSKEEMAPARGITVTYRVTVTSKVTESMVITGIVSSHHNALQGGDCGVWIGTTLETGDQFSCSFSGRIADKDNLSERNVVAVTVADDDENFETERDFSLVTTTDIKPDIVIQRTVDADGDGLFGDSEVAVSSGATVTVQVSITNRMSEPLLIRDIVDEPYEVTSDSDSAVDGDGTCQSLIDSTLEGFATGRCTFDGRITVDDNAVETGRTTVYVTDDDGNEAASFDDATVLTPDLLPSIVVSKRVDANGDGIFSKTEEAPAGPITVTFQVSITSAVRESLIITSIVDGQHNAMAANGTCAGLIGSELVANGTRSCLFSDLLSTEDSEVSDVLVTVQDDDANRRTTRATSTVHRAESIPVLALRVENDADDDGRYSDDEQAPSNGVGVLFRVSISNPLTRSLTVGSISDTRHDATDAAGTCDGLIGTVILTSSVASCLFPGIVGDSENGAETNTVTVTLTDSLSNIVTIADSSVVRTPDVQPQISVVATNDADQDGTFTVDERTATAGISASFQISISNSANEPVTIAQIVDDKHKVTGSNCDALLNEVLLPGAQLSCVYAGQLPDEDNVTEQNRVTVKASDDDGNVASAQDVSTVHTPDIVPAIRVNLFNDADLDGFYQKLEIAPSPGITLFFRMSMTNIGPEDLFIRSLDDDLYDINQGDCANLVDYLLPVGATIACSYSDMLTNGDAAAQINTVIVTGVDDDGSLTTAMDSSTVVVADIEPAVSVRLENDADGDTIFSGAEKAAASSNEVTYRATIRNQAREGAFITSMTDSVHTLDGSPCDALIGTEIPGDSSLDCTFVGTPPAARTRAVTSNFRVSVEDDDANRTSSADRSTVTPPDYTPAVELTVLTNGERSSDGQGPWLVADEAVTWTYIVSNTGDVMLSTISIVDDQLGADPVCTLTSLDVGADAQCLVDGSVIDGPYTNRATVAAEVPDGSRILDSAGSAYAGYVPAAVGNLVFEDIHPDGLTTTDIRLGNGVQDDGEHGIAGVVVQLYRVADDGQVAETNSDEEGRYRIDGLIPGDYYLVFGNIAYNGQWVVPVVGKNSAIDSDADPDLLSTDDAQKARSVDFTLTSGEYRDDIDAGLYSLTLGASILGGRVWLDVDRDGLQGESEPGLDGVDIQLHGEAGELLVETVSDVSGEYRFDAVPAGQYRLQVVRPAGHSVSPQDVGEIESVDNDADLSGSTTLITLPAEVEDVIWDFGFYQTLNDDPVEPGVFDRQIYLPSVHR